MMVPTVPGTSLYELLRDLTAAMDAVRTAMRAVMRTAPKRGHYDALGDGNFARAIQEHRSRIERLRDLFIELNAIAEAICSA
jgi:hypothetical protein